MISKTDAKQIAETLPNETVREIMRLRRQGESYYDISATLDLPYPYVVQYAVAAALKLSLSDPKKVKRRAEEDRLEHLFSQAHAAFLSSGSVDWYDRLLKTSERKCKLLGLDAPAEQVVTGKKGGPIQFQSLDLKGLTDAELATMKALALKSMPASE